MIDQGELFQVPNPCKGICEVNNKGYCKGCYRSRQERFHWNEMTDYQKHLVVQLCGNREKRIAAARRAKELEAQNQGQIPVTRDDGQFDLFEERDPQMELLPPDTDL